MNKNPLISIIIPVFNEQATIVDCLASLAQQTYTKIEIIIIDDGSTDKTVKEIQDFAKQNQSLRLILLSQDHQGPGTARNLGAKKSGGEILVFVDADMTFDGKFIDKLTSPIRKDKTIGTFTKDEHVANNDNKWAKSWSLLRGWPEGRMHPVDYPDEQAVFRAILKKEFNKVGGFDTSRGYDDDWSLSERLGTLATVAPGAIVYHNNPDSLSTIYEQSKWMAKRRYKLGILGKIITLIKLSPIFSVFTAYTLKRKHSFPPVFTAKLVSDIAQIKGIVESFSGKTSR